MYTHIYTHVQLGNDHNIMYIYTNTHTRTHTHTYHSAQVTTAVHNRAQMELAAEGSYGKRIASLDAHLVVDACCYEDYHSHTLVTELQVHVFELNTCVYV